MNPKKIIYALFSFHGCLSRGQFLGYTIVGILALSGLATAIINIMPPDTFSSSELLLNAAAYILAVWMLCALVMKRTRDIGLPPVLGIIGVVMGVCAGFTAPVLLLNTGLQTNAAIVISSLLKTVPYLLVCGLLMTKTAAVKSRDG